MGKHIDKIPWDAVDHTNTLPVLLGLMGGLATFGAIGIILGPVVIALALALLRFAEEERAV